MKTSNPKVTAIVTDQRGAYNGLATWVTSPYAPYIHKTVNHQQSFVNPITSFHTQQIESCWTDLKLRFIKMIRKAGNPTASKGIVPSSGFSQFVIHAWQLLRKLQGNTHSEKATVMVLFIL